MQCLIVFGEDQDVVRLSILTLTGIKGWVVLLVGEFVYNITSPPFY